jgi:hypothetical protein
MRVSHVGVILLGCGYLSGCAVVPPLNENGIAISEIVQRVKCELAIAMPEPEPPYPTGRYQWMGDWTAKVDLTLITNDQSAITPSTSFITPMLPQSVPLIGTFSRSFTLGLGGGLTNNAIRNETMSFTVSIKELRNERYRGDCHLPNGFDLYGHLGLQEWIESALAPVDRDMLTIGYHAAPGSKSGSSPRISVDANDKDRIHQAAFFALKYAKDAEAAAAASQRYSVQYQKDAKVADTAVTKRDIQQTFDQASAASGDANVAAGFVTTANDVFSHLAVDDPLRKDPQVLQDVSDAKTAGVRASAAKKAAAATVKSLPQDPPIDSIGHQIQFIVLTTANATPSWSLVHFKGPGASGSLAAVTETRTHTLNIALGAPSGSVNASQEQLRQLGNLHLDSLRLQPN